MSSGAPLLLSNSSAFQRRSMADCLAAALGLSAGALGWSGLSQAASEETASQLLLLPEHYELMENGVVVFKLETGETLSLTSDQYLIMEDGLLLITDELAQASVYSLPVMGAVRAQLMSDVQPVRSPDGSVVLASDDSPLWSGDGPAPRLFEQVDLQRYEIAQASDGSSSEVGEAVAVGLLSPGAIALLGVFMTSDQPEGDAEVEETPAPPSAPEFWTDADIADSASTAITGSSADSFVGYTAASTAAATDPLTKVGFGSGNSATFDMSAGGNNAFVAGTGAASFSGSVAYTGGAGADTLTFGVWLATRDGSATFDMSAGGNNTLVAGTTPITSPYGAGGAAGLDGSMSYTGGPGDDTLIFGDNLAWVRGSATFDMSRGGDNTLVAGDNAASNTASLVYIGGAGDDSLTFGAQLAGNLSSATFDMSEGGSNTFVAGSSAISGNGSIVYKGGTGDDSLTFGGNSLEGIATFDMTAGGSNHLTAGRDAGSGGGTLTYSGGSGPDELVFGDNAALDGSFNVDLGADSVADTITFEGYVGAGGAGGVQIQNFNVFDDSLTVARAFSVMTDSSPQGTITGIELADQYGTIHFTGLTGVSYTDFVSAITVS